MAQTIYMDNGEGKKLIEEVVASRKVMKVLLVLMLLVKRFLGLLLQAYNHFPGNKFHFIQ